MEQAYQINPNGELYSDTSVMRAQLLREIDCLERQLERLQLRDDMLAMSTLHTYQDMINSRKEMVDQLP